MNDLELQDNIIEVLERSDKENEIRTSIQKLFKHAYFTGCDREKRKENYALLYDISFRLLGKKVDYEILT